MHSICFYVLQYIKRHNRYLDYLIKITENNRKISFIYDKCRGMLSSSSPIVSLIKTNRSLPSSLIRSYNNNNNIQHLYNAL